MRQLGLGQNRLLDVRLRQSNSANGRTLTLCSRMLAYPVMMNDLLNLANLQGGFNDFVRASIFTRLFMVVLFFVIAWILSRFLPRLVSKAVLSATRETRRNRPLSLRRQETIHNLTGDLTVFVLYLVAAISSLALFVDSRGLFTFLGLFSAGFGLGARPVVSDYISGLVFLFEDQYSIGDKVEINGVEGTVEQISMRTTTVRSMSGELYFIPNGEIRIIRNFARGVFSPASVHLRVKSSQLHQAMAVLNRLIADYDQFDHLVEAPRIVSEDGVIGSDVELTLLAKAEYGFGVEARHQLIEYINAHMAQADIEINA